MGNVVESDEEFSQQFAEIDYNGDGKVSFEELERYLYTAMQITENDSKDSSFLSSNGVETAQLTPESISAITKLFEENKVHF